MRKAARASYEDLYQNAPFGYLTTDSNDVISRANATICAMTGYAEADLVGRPFSSLLTSGARLFYETRHLPVLHLQGAVREVLLGLSAANGSTIPILVNADLVADPLGQPAEIRIAILDATERENYERMLLGAQRASELLATRVAVLQDAAARFSLTSTEVELTEVLATIVSEALVASDCCVALVIEGKLEVVAGTNPLEGLVDRDSPTAGPDAMRSEVPVVVTVEGHNAAEYPEVARALATARLATVAIFPIMREGTPIGVVGAFFGRERVIDATESDLVVSLSRQAAQVLVRIRAQEELAHLALHDPLTNLPNRLLLRTRISDVIESASISSTALSLMFIDLDGFKKVNDELGHVVGDALLREVASRLKAAVRDSDELGRYGGDEFVTLCSDTTAEDAMAIAGRIRDVIRAPFDSAPGFVVSASVGLATYTPTPDRTVSTDEILTVADAAMYESKREGRDRTTAVNL